jgi:dolichol-phosphate mannosyltransferase
MNVAETPSPSSLAVERDLPRQHGIGAELSVIVPTFNERDNVAELITRLAASLEGCAWEVIFVDDDSPDDTADLVRTFGAADGRVRCVQRIGRRGLASATVEGMLASTAPYLAVIDGDLQHDERLLPAMLELLRGADTDIVVGSRYAPGGDVSDWDAKRERMSRFAMRFSRVLVPAELTDPMSGFFMLRRPVLTRSVHKLSGMGFKILADLFASSPEPLRFKELAYRFAPRRAGESKLDALTAWDYLMLLLDKMVGHYIPVRFLAFAIVGSLGVAVHFAVLTPLYGPLHRSFIESQAVATLCAMTFNFALNNILTYRDRQLRGWGWVRGWLSFVVACSVGGLANVGVASALFDLNDGWFVPAVAGILVSAIWNYAITTLFTWRQPKRRAKA